MKLIRKLLIGILGIEGYIRLISKIYIGLVSRGFLRKQYPELFFLQTIVKPGDYCIDIGANLGYYSTLLSRHAGSKGKIFAVEPIPMFYEIWKKNTKRSNINNLELMPYALGSEQKTVQMGMPEKDGLLHHGMTKIASIANEKYVRMFDVKMRNPDILFADLKRLDFVKCDVEGYESEVFSNMKNTLRKFMPLIQSELSGMENRKKVIALMTELGYKTSILSEQGNLIPATEEIILNTNKDFYFSAEKHGLFFQA